MVSHPGAHSDAQEAAGHAEFLVPGVVRQFPAHAEGRPCSARGVVLTYLLSQLSDVTGELTSGLSPPFIKWTHLAALRVGVHVHHIHDSVISEVALWCGGGQWVCPVMTRWNYYP